MKNVIKYAKGYRYYILLIACAGIGCSIANVWIIDILKSVVDMSLAGNMWQSLPATAVRAAAVIAVGMIANYLVIKVTGVLGAKLLHDMRRDMVKHIMKLSVRDMEKNNFGDLMERVSSDVSVIAGYIQTYFKDCLYVPIVVVVFGIYLFSMNGVLACVCLAPLAVMVPLSVKLLGPVKKSQADYVKKLGYTNNNIKEAFDGADVIKSYNLQERMEAKYYDALKETFDISNRNDLRQYNIEPLSALIREAPTAIALCLGGWLALQGRVTLGVLVAFISGIEKINEPLVYAYQLVVRTQMALISVDRVFDILKLPVEDEGRMPDKVEPGTVFEMEGVSFGYGEEKILDGIDLRVDKGKKVAFVGPSGCGKSTVLKLLCGQYEVWSGKMLLYGNEYGKVTSQAVREEMALISQEAVIFPMSVMDNLRIGRPDATRAEIEAAARLAGCHEFIVQMSRGYDEILEEKGANLSGGQRQRISIARALLSGAQVLLLDEPTSALDSKTESQVNQALMELAKGKTVVTVAHRLRTIVDYDEIVVMEHGRIVERGRHGELLEAGGRYAKLYALAGGEE